MTRAPYRWLLLLLLAGVLPATAGAQEQARVLSDTTLLQVIRLRDGSQVVGRISEMRADSLVIRTASGQLVVARDAVLAVRERPANAMRDGQYWPEDPYATRYLVAPSARTLRRGEAYFCDIWVFVLCLTVGASDRVTLGGGFSLFPGIDFSENVFYLTPKVGLVARENFQFALGAFTGWTGGVTDVASSFGILYGVATAGGEDRNASAGLGYAYWNRDFSDQPIVLLAGKWRLSRGTALISENHILPESNGIVSLGLRFFNERIAGDVALLTLPGESDVGLIPFVGLAVKFR